MVSASWALIGRSWGWGGRRSALVSRLIQIGGSIHCLMTVGLKFSFLCWLLPESLFKQINASGHSLHCCSFQSCMESFSLSPLSEFPFCNVSSESSFPPSSGKKLCSSEPMWLYWVYPGSLRWFLYVKSQLITSTPHLVCLTSLHFTDSVFILQIKDSWQPCIDYVYWHHFSNGICSPHVSVCPNSQNMSNFITIIFVMAICDQWSVMLWLKHTNFRWS